MYFSHSSLTSILLRVIDPNANRLVLGVVILHSHHLHITIKFTNETRFLDCDFFRDYLEMYNLYDLVRLWMWCRDQSIYP
jgi:hypothetical protein